MDKYVIQFLVFIIGFLVYMICTKSPNKRLEDENDDLRIRLKTECDYNLALHNILKQYEKKLGANQVEEILNETLKNLKEEGG